MVIFFSFCYVFAHMSDVTYVDAFLLQTLKLLDFYKRERSSALLVTVDDFVWLPLERLRRYHKRGTQNLDKGYGRPLLCFPFGGTAV